MNEEVAKAYTLFTNLYSSNEKFKTLIDENMKNGKIRFFNEDEFERIKNLNYRSQNPNFLPNDFYELFKRGYNIGNCVHTSRVLSYAYNFVDIVHGRLPLISGTLNAENGGHAWLELRSNHFDIDLIIDTSLMLVIDISLKEKFGYIDEIREDYRLLNKDSRYSSQKSFANDKLKKKMTK